MTPTDSDRLIGIFIRWDDAPAVAQRVVHIARQHRLVVFDPQGPDVHTPRGIPREPPHAAERHPLFPRLVILIALGLCFALAAMSYLASQAMPR